MSRPSFRRLWRTLILLLVDLGLVWASFLLAYWLRFVVRLGEGLGPIQPVPVAPLVEYVKALAVVSYVWLFTFQVLGLYDRDRFTDFIEEIYALLKGISFGSLIILSFTFFYRGFESGYSRMVVVYAWLLNLVLMVLHRYLLYLWRRHRKRRGREIQRVLLVGGGEMARILGRKILAHPELGFRVAGRLTVGEPPEDADDEIPVLGGVDRLEELASAHGVDAILIAETNLPHYRLLEIIAYCEVQGLEIRMAPTVFDLVIDLGDLADLDGLPLVSLREKPLDELSLTIKRLFDLALAMVLLLLTLPIWIGIALAIKVDSRGPVFFVQWRAGRDGKPFRMLKFRTMVAGAEELQRHLMPECGATDPLFKLPRDPRVTRVGHFLRRWSLDELPQLLNVLLNDMSFVGPRPEEVKFTEQYDIWQRRRLKVKPGITGLQQVTCRGTLSLAERVRYDVFYIRKRSLILDILILLRTLPVVFSGHGAF